MKVRPNARQRCIFFFPKTVAKSRSLEARRRRRREMLGGGEAAQSEQDGKRKMIWEGEEFKGDMDR